MVLVGSPSPAGWSCAAQAKPAAQIQAQVLGGEQQHLPVCGAMEGTRPLSPRLLPQYPSPPGKQGQEEQSLKRLLTERGSPVPLTLCSFFQLPPLFHTSPYSSFIPTSPSLSPALIPYLPTHAVALSSLSFSFSLACFSFLHSPLVPACVFTCYGENITSFHTSFALF